MKVLVTGATGFVGNALLNRLACDASYVPVAAVRREVPNELCSCGVINVGELDGDTDWSSAVSDVDVVIHAAARVHVMKDLADDPLSQYRKTNVEGTLNLARQAAEANVKRFIFISSIKVNGERTRLGKPFTAEQEPAPVDPYGISKWESETALCHLAEDTGMEVVVIRPPLVYGPDVKANFRRMMYWIYKGIPIPLGAIHNRRSFVALDNLVDLILTCVTHPAAANQTFLASDGDDISTSSLLQEIGKGLGKRAWLIPCPEALLRFSALMLGKRDLAQRLLDSLQVDITKTRLLLNWEPPVSLHEGMRKTAERFKEVTSTD